NDFGVKRLPVVSEWIFALAHAWPMVEIGLLVALIAIVVLLLILATPAARAVRERFLRWIPGVAQVYWASVLARFTHTSALAAVSGVPLPELIGAAGQASGGAALARAATGVRERLESGVALTEAARGQRDVPALWLCVVSSAGPRGELPAALEELARAYEARA